MRLLPLLLPVLLAGPIALSAQPATIQVSVSDTIEVPANHISVMISFNEPAEDATFPSPPDFSASRTEVIRLLDQHQVSWKKASDQLGFLGMMGRTGGSGQEMDEIIADFSSAVQLEKVLPLLRLVPSVEAVVTGTSVDKELLDLTRLYEKLFAKARAKADVMARISGKKVGGIFQIGSPFDAFSPGNVLDPMQNSGGAYADLMKTMFGNMFGNMFGEIRPDYQVPVSENLTVIYYLLD